MEMSSYEYYGEDTIERPSSRSMVTQSGLGNRKTIIIGVSVVALCVIGIGFGIGFGLDHDTIGMSLLC